jgi:ElaB/YqjD/DUF883 family membrane-anchored ribosome-binding protein
MAKAEKKSVDPGVAGASSVAAGSSDPGSVPEQAKEKVQEGAVVVQEKAEELKTDAGERVRQELQTRSTQAGAQLHSTAAAMRRSTEQLREEGNDGAAKAMEFVAERADRFGGYLTGVHADQMLRDVESFARRQPWLATLGGAAVGFFASRFLKASSTARYHGTTAATGSREAWQPHPPTRERPSLASDAALATKRQQSSDQPVVTSQRGSSNG